MPFYMLLHGHHENENGCPLSVGYQSLAARRAQIKDIKPKAEQPLRLALICNVRPEELPTKARKARDARDNAWDVYNKAWDAYDKARDVCDKAGDVCDKAGDAFVTSLTPSQWERWHKKVCKHPGCKWTAEHPSIF